MERIAQGGAAIGRGDPASSVLEGVVVVDLTQYLAGPACTRMLMELGAEVIKVELAPYGDPSRSFTLRHNRRSGFFVQQNRGKRSVCVDLGDPAGVEVVLRLAAAADVLVENFTPGVMARRGLGYERLCEVNPGLIVASISGFGQTGPLADRPAFDFVAQAYAGVMHMTGEPDGPPLFAGIGLADVNVGVHAFAAIGHALFRRERTGAGAHLDIAMVDSLVHMQETGIYAPSMTDSDYVPLRQGRFYQPSQPGGVYRGPDGWVVVFCTQGQVDGLWAAMGRPDLASDTRFATNDGRIANRDELTVLIETWMATFIDVDRVVEALEAHRVPCSKVRSPAELVHDPHLRARDAVRMVPDPRLGTVATPGFPIHFGGDTPPARLGPDDVLAPDLGQDNRSVLRDLAGYAEHEIDVLEARGVLHAKDH